MISLGGRKATFLGDATNPQDAVNLRGTQSLIATAIAASPSSAASPWEQVVPAISGDNGPAINSAIDDLFATYGGGTILLRPEIYDISTTILRRSNVFIKGAFRGSWVFEGDPTKGTVIRWTGANGGLVFKDDPVAPEFRVDSGGISDLTIDGNDLAAYGIQAWNVMSPSYARLHCTGIVTNGVAYYWNAHLNGQGLGWESCYHIRVDDLSVNVSGGATGLWLDGTAASGNNITFGSLRNCHVTFQNGDAYRIDFGDNNRFSDCGASRIAGGTGFAIRLGAHSFANGFSGFNSNANIRALSGSMGNYIYDNSVDHVILLTEDVSGSCIVYSFDGTSIDTHKGYNNYLEMDLNGWIRRLATGNVTINADDGDFMYFDRAANIWSFYIDDVRAGYIDSTGWHNG